MAEKIVIEIPMNFNLELNETELQAVREYYGFPEKDNVTPEQLSESIENEVRQMISDIETDYLSDLE
jgi:hypothetical protein